MDDSVFKIKSKKRPILYRSFKKGDVFWRRNKIKLGTCPVGFVIIFEITNDGIEFEPGNEILYRINYLNTHITNPHRLRKVMGEDNIERFYIKMTNNEAHLARILFKK